MLCFTISNLKSTRTHKGWRVELSCKPLTILESANSYRNSIFFSYAMYYTFHCVFLHCISHVSLSFLLIALESMYYPSSISFLFRKRSTIGHLNVQFATAENEEQYILSIILYITFQNCFSFLWSFL